MRSALIANSAVAAIVALAALAAPAPASAAPGNDEFANATDIGSLPFNDSVTGVETATNTSTTDLTLFCRRNATFGQGNNSLWYRYTSKPDTTSARPEYLKLSTAGSSYDTVVQVVEGPSPGKESMVLGGCADAESAQETGVVRLDKPNTSYYVEIASPTTLPNSPASLSLNVTSAPEYTVTGTADGAGTCSAGSCTTLRAAVAAANASPGTIVLEPRTYTLSTPIGTEGAGNLDNTKGDLDATGSMLIDGTGSTKSVIDAGGQDRALQLDAPATLALSNTRITGGVTTGNGGNIDVRGGFLDAEHVEIDAGQATGHGGNVSVADNAVRLHRSELSGGQASAQGGNLYIGTIVRNALVNRSAITGGTGAGGGGVYAIGTTMLANSTITGNTASGITDGGGVSKPSGGSLFLINNTLTANHADGAGAKGGGLRFAVPVTVLETIMAGNTASAEPDCSAVDSLTMYAPFNSRNVVEVADSCIDTGPPSVFSDIVDDPDLRAPGKYGNVTTIAPPRPGSNAIDAISGSSCPVSNVAENADLTTDQRDLPRPVDGGSSQANRCDIGAVEVQPPSCQPTVFSTPVNTPANVTLPCSDPDGDPIDTLVINAGPQHGVLLGTGATSRTFTPSAGYVGPDSFTFSATAGTLASNVASAAVTVTAAPPSPPPPPLPPSTPARGTGGGGTTAKDTKAPILRGLAVKASKRRSSAEFQSDEGGRFAALLTRTAPGVRKGKRCVARPRKAPRGKRRCTRQLKVKATGGPAKAGKNSVGLGKLGAHSYRLQISVTDAAGNKSKPLVRAFRIKAKE